MTPDGDVVTEVTVSGANCPWCLNETVDRLREEPGVHKVEVSAARECLMIRHDDMDRGRLLDVIRTHLHGDDTSTPEHLMVQVDPQPAELHCSHRHRTGDDAE